MSNRHWVFDGAHTDLDVSVPSELMIDISCPQKDSAASRKLAETAWHCEVPAEVAPGCELVAVSRHDAVDCSRA